MIEIYIIRINEKGFALNSLLWNYVSVSRQQVASRYKRPLDKHRSLMGEVLARIAICKSLQVSNCELAFDKNEFGKPLLVNPQGHFFNTSHAGDWVVCAFSDQPVGIDIERIKPIDVSIAERFFARSEFNALISKSGQSQLNYFFRLWTLKESYVKAIGRGLSFPLDSFSCEIDGDNRISAVFDAGIPNALFQQSFVDDGHVMAICTFRELITRIRQLDYIKLVNLIHELDVCSVPD